MFRFRFGKLIGSVLENDFWTPPPPPLLSTSLGNYQLISGLSAAARSRTRTHSPLSCPTPSCSTRPRNSLLSTLVQNNIVMVKYKIDRRGAGNRGQKFIYLDGPLSYSHNNWPPGIFSEMG